MRRFLLILFVLTLEHRVLGLDQSTFANRLQEYNFFSNAAATFGSACHNGSCMSAEVGFKGVKQKENVKSSSLFRVGSNTKFMTTILTLKMVEEGRLSLQDEMTDFLPQFSNWRGVTVEHLLHQSSGIPAYIFNEAGLKRVSKALLGFRRKIWQPNELINLVANQPLEFEPGSRMVYNNTNFILVGMILETLTQQPLELLFTEKLFKPLGMSNTFLLLPPARANDLVRGYAAGDILPFPGWLSFFLTNKIRKKGPVWDVTNAFHESFTWTAGSAVSTAFDLTTLTNNLFKGELLSTDHVERMKEMEAGEVLGQPLDYGLGMFRYPTRYGYVYGHGGLTPGYQSNTGYLEEEDLVLTIAQNKGPGQVFAIFGQMITDFVTEDTSIKFEPVAEISRRRKTGITLRVKGYLPQGNEPTSALGSMDFFGKLKNEDGFNRFRISNDTLDERKAIVLTVDAMGIAGTSKKQQLSVALDRNYIDQKVKNSARVSAVQIPAKYVSVVLTKENSRGRCRESLLDKKRSFTAQLSIEEPTAGLGGVIKIYAYIPMEKLRKAADSSCKDKL